MYQNTCSKCGSAALYTEKKGNNTGLYCEECGAFQKWLGKDEVRVFEHSQKSRGLCSTANVYEDTIADNILKERLNRFVEFLNKLIDKEMSQEPLSVEDSIRKNSYCLALEQDKNAVLNILNDQEFDYSEKQI